MRLGNREGISLANTREPQIELTKLGRAIDTVMINYFPIVLIALPFVGAGIGAIVGLLIS